MPLKVFISYAEEDKALAQAWRTLLRTISANGISPWFSSDLAPGGGMQTGIWRKNLYDEISQSKVVLAIQTPTSLGHPWIAFECGLAGGLHFEKDIIPVLYRLEKGKWSSPLNSYQAYQGDTLDDVRRVCDMILKMGEQEVEDEDFFRTCFKSFSNTISLDVPKENTLKTIMDLYIFRIEEKIKEDKKYRVPNLRQQMYAALPQPFEPFDPKLHDLLSGLLMELGRYEEAVEEIDFGLSLLRDDARFLQRKAAASLRLHNLGQSEDIINSIYTKYNRLDRNFELALLEGLLFWEKYKLTNSNDESLLEKSYQAFLKPHNTAQIPHCDCYSEKSLNSPDPQDYEMTRHCACLNAARVAIRLRKSQEISALYEGVLRRYNILKINEDLSCEYDLIAGEIYLGLKDTGKAKGAYAQAMRRVPPPSEEARYAALHIVLQISEIVSLGDSTVSQIEDILYPNQSLPSDHPVAIARAAKRPPEASQTEARTPAQ